MTDTLYRVTWKGLDGNTKQGAWITKEVIDTWKRDSYPGLPKKIKTSIKVECSTKGIKYDLS